MHSEKRETDIADEYPKGFRLVSIVVAVALCIFLFALDMVG
jgi:hypothetical protein